MGKRSRRRGARAPVRSIDHHIAIVQTQLTHFSGPVPSPEMLREYGSIIENGAERVFRMAEEQGEHRRTVERAVLISGVRLQYAGLAIAGMWSAALACGGWILAHEGRSLLGVAAIIAALTPAGVFIYGRRSQTEERLRRLLELERASHPRAQQNLPFD